MHPVVFQAGKIKVINVSIFTACNMRNTKDSGILHGFVRIVFLCVCMFHP